VTELHDEFSDGKIPLLMVPVLRSIALAHGKDAKLAALREGARDLAIPVKLGIINSHGVKLYRPDVIDRLRDQAETYGLLKDPGQEAVEKIIAEGLDDFTGPRPPVSEIVTGIYKLRAPQPPPQEDGSQARQGTYSPWHYHDEKPSPPTPWLIKKLLPETGSGLISGQWGTYKTTSALDICVSIMSGKPFAGRFAIKRKGGVIYFAPEGAGGIKSRLDTIAKERGVTGILPFAWRSDCPPLMAPYALDHLVRLFNEASRDLKERCGVDIVLALVDTIIAAASYRKAGDDNDTAAAQVLMSRLSDLSKRTGALVLGVDHFGKIAETGTRGSSAKEGHADVVLALLGDRQLNGTITNTRLALRKLRDGPSGLEIPFTPRDVQTGTDEDGELITRKVIEWGSASIATEPSAWEKSLLRRILMQIVSDAGVNITPFADGPIVRAVDIKLVREEFKKQYVAAGDDKKRAAARRQAFKRQIDDAQKSFRIGVREIDNTQFIWLVLKAEEIPGEHGNPTTS
jgi:AAA domain